MKASVYLIAGAVFVLGSYYAMSFKPRGIRNNNPGNIRLTDIPWYGKVPNDVNTDGEFEQFYEVENGIRAMARNIKTAYDQGTNSLAGIIERWAPRKGTSNAGESYTQDTGSYVQSVSRRIGVEPGRVVPVDKVPELIKAMIHHENGLMPYDEDTIMAGVRRAGWRV